MKQFVLIVATLYGALSVMLGALGAHALKKVLTPEVLESFNTGVKYQMYHAIVLLIAGLYFSFTSRIEILMGWSFILGVFFFSVSIYLLSMSTLWNVNLKPLGPVTPLGGFLMIAGWVLLLVHVVKIKTV